ncbi:class I SAM-dependent methyltransferase [Shinella sp. G-2]|uniref:class I SAM-dependent methyltransferase n=1 Tax=Shinella sp. G-2 TaxID=3133141 RepID=UPI003D018AB0
MQNTFQSYLQEIMKNGGAILTKSLKSWRAGIDYETNFWESWFSTRGLEWPEDYINRLQPQEMPDWIQNLLPTNQSFFRILDVGSGPITKTGQIIPGRSVDITATDPLARHYDAIMEKFDVAPPLRTTFSFAEDLSARFPNDHFDLILCTNALDHAIEPVWGIVEMLICLKIGGLVYLGHRRNEAEFEDYSGFHQWNFDEVEGSFIVWNKERRINVTELLSGFAAVATTLHGDHIGVNIVKNQGLPIDAHDYQRQARATLLGCLFSL